MDLDKTWSQAWLCWRVQQQFNLLIDRPTDNPLSWKVIYIKYIHFSLSRSLSLSRLSVLLWRLKVLSRYLRSLCAKGCALAVSSVTSSPNIHVEIVAETYHQSEWRRRHNTHTRAQDTDTFRHLCNPPVSELCRIRSSTAAYRKGVTDISVLRFASTWSPAASRQSATTERQKHVKPRRSL
jgi:hypothetical protein